MPSATIRRPEAPIRATVHLPRSKSVANRALIAAALAGDLSCIEYLSDADDTRTLYHLLRDKPRVMDCGLGGTTFRFLLAWAAVQQDAEHVLTGDAKLLERPHDDLIDALRKLGALIERTPEGYRVKGVRLDGGTIAFESPISSQYLSALMLVAPCMDKGLRIEWRGTQLSRPYVEMTAKVMRHFGAEVEVGETLIEVRPGRYTAKAFEVPRDWSAAAFWYEIVALADDAEVELVGLWKDGVQGDEAIVHLLSPFVSTRAIESGLVISLVRIDGRFDFIPGFETIDLSSSPDLFQPLFAAFTGNYCPTCIKGLDNVRTKETDRIAATIATLRSIGYYVFEEPKGVVNEPVFNSFSYHELDPRGDHRMAMALAPLALDTGSITILDPDVVTKSYPGFWEDLERAGFGVEREE